MIWAIVKTYAQKCIASLQKYFGLVWLWDHQPIVSSSQPVELCQQGPTFFLELIV